MKQVTIAALCAVGILTGSAKAGIIDFNSVTVKAHASQNRGSFEIQDEGSALVLTENSWFGVKVSEAFGLSSLDLRDPTTNYVLDFDFRLFDLENSGRSEIAGLYFGDFSRRTVDHDPARTVVFSGTQQPGNPYGIRDFDYNFSTSEWISFSIDLNDVLSGKVTDIIFLNDCDDGCANLNVGFRNLSLSSEVSEPTAVSLALLGMGFIGWRARRQKRV